MWSTRSGANPTASPTGPSSDHTLGNASGKYIYSVGSTNNGIDGEQTTIESTPITISGVSSVDISFWDHMFGNNINRLVVDVYMNGSWMAIDSLVGQQQTSAARRLAAKNSKNACFGCRYESTF